MTRFTYAMSVSADGFAAAADGSLDWVEMDEEVHARFNDLARGADAFVYGRGMWEVMAPFWPNALNEPDAEPVMADFARVWRDTAKVVFSSTLSEVGYGARLVKGDVVDAVPALREEFAGRILVGGPGIAAPLIQHDLIDEYVVSVHPVILGGGTPFFPPLASWLRLRLLETKVFGGGAVLHRYERRT